MLAIGGLLLLLIYTAAPPTGAAAPLAEVTTIALSDDDGGAALFRGQELLAPVALSRCLTVSYSGPGGAGEIRLLARNVTGTLGGSLAIQVQVGTGGGFASCAGFTSTAMVFDGTLAGLAAAANATVPGVAAGWRPAGSGTRTYRITASVPDDNSAQGRAATADLSWVFLAGPGGPPSPAPSQPPAPSPPPAASPPPAPSPPPAASPPPAQASPTGPESAPPAEPSATPPAPGAPEPTGGAASPGGEPGPGGQAPDERPGGVAGAVSAAVAAVTGAISRAAEEVGEFAAKTVAVASDLGARTARHGQYPLVSVLAMLAFLLAQNRFDRRDPKLALAPISRRPYLSFHEDAIDPEQDPHPDNGSRDHIETETEEVNADEHPDQIW
jgi:hypothetical protein